METEEGFAAFCPALPGCASQGASLEEATVNIRDAIAEVLDAGGAPAKDGGSAAEAEILREAAADRLKVTMREVQLPVPA
ncbi:MAG: type II toxin-antitoxin system HicB family antitoxin [Verrucomicrobia bacterium]|nr:type II toxin-antitoxin system HicB family antitoxin [Verrucomicrobiota bacterium]